MNRYIQIDLATDNNIETQFHQTTSTTYVVCTCIFPFYAIFNAQTDFKMH